MSTPLKITQQLDHVVPDVKDWPIYKVSQDKEAFLKEIIQRTQEEILAKFESPTALHDELKSVLFQEKNRLTKTPWKADSPEEKTFWSEIKRKILLSSKEEDEDIRYKKDKKILKKILDHYAHEIVANFEPAKYRKIRKILPWVFARLMNASPGESWKFLSKNRKTIYDKLKITGPIEHIRNLAKQGTVVVVPTHFSNLDSPTIGFVIDVIGLPAMTYGAGLNLFTLKLLSNWMGNLGAYKLDRRKKNTPYLELLKNYSTVALQRGVHSLFFPGGTRSRSGKIEKRLKLGLLSTAVEAQRQNLTNFQEETAKKIFIVPAVINYHFVMEAESLIKQHLAIEGKEQFIAEREDFSTSYKLIKLVYKFLTATAGMTISFATPLDVLGNEVNEEGKSINKIGQEVNIKDYFLRDGVMSEDKQRDFVYTKMLGEEIVKKFHSHNTVLTSHLLAFTAFQLIKRDYPNLDLFEFLRIPVDEIEIDYDTLRMEVEKVKNRVIELFAEEKLQVSHQIKGETDALIKHGLKNLGVYHAQMPLIKKDNNTVLTQDLKLLYFYHNRLEGYGLDKLFQ
ncbi:MAG: 1-acyl-sn-glycerol-3-phosphate acyltransferase [Chitinophagales bacterium]